MGGDLVALDEDLPVTAWSAAPRELDALRLIHEVWSIA